MRILIAHSFYRQAGGEDRYVAQQAALLATDHEVRLEARANAELDAGALTAARMITNRAERRALDEAISTFSPDVIHLHNPYPSLGPAVHQAADRAGVPLIQTVHNFRLRCPNGFMFTEGAPCQRCVGGRYDNAITHACFPSKSQSAAYAAALWVHRFGMRLEDKVTTYVAPSRFVQQRLLGWGFEQERVALVRNFTTPPDEVAPVGDHGLYLGRLSEEKGVDVLLRALTILGDPPFEIAGEGPDMDRLQALAAMLGLRRVRFLGLVPGDQVPATIERARYVAFPSTWDENAPLAALEAMGRGRPIVASAVGGLPELAEDGRGRLFPAGDERAMAEAIEIYADRDIATDDGARARDFILETCSPAAHERSLIDVYARSGVEMARSRPGTGHPTPRGFVHGVTLPTSSDGNVPTPLVRRGRAAPHVLMVHCYYRDLGGESLSFESETRLLRQSGVRVTTYTRDNREIDSVGPLGRVQIGLRTIWAQDAYRQIAEVVRAERPDVVHFQNTFPLISPSALHAVHRLGVPVVQALRNYRLVCASGVLYRDGHVCTDCVGRRLPTPALQHACYHDSRPRTIAVTAMQVAHRALGTWSDVVDIYVAPSRFARDLFVDAGLDPERVMVKPNFVAPDPGMRQETGEGVLFAGRLAPEKGVLTLLEAWKALPDIRLRIAGDGPLRRELARIIEAEGLSDRVELLGPQSPERILELIADSRCLVFPSQWYETFGRVAAEAFACGVPVVASRLGAMAEVVSDGVTGRLFESGNAQALAEAVRQVMTRDDHQAYRTNARKAYEQHYTPEANLELLLEVYDRAMTTGSRSEAGQAAGGV